MKKLLALLLAMVMVLSLVACTKAPAQTTTAPVTTAPATEPEVTEPPVTEPVFAYSEAPYITDLGTYGNVEDRLPVEEDIFVSQYDANGDALEIGTSHGGGTVPFEMPDGHGRAHQPDEYISINGLLESIEIAALMLIEADKM